MIIFKKIRNFYDIQFIIQRVKFNIISPYIIFNFMIKIFYIVRYIITLT